MENHQVQETIRTKRRNSEKRSLFSQNKANTKSSSRKAAQELRKKQLAKELGIPKSTIDNKVKTKHQKKVGGKQGSQRKLKVCSCESDTFTAWKMPLAKIDVRLLVQDY